LRLPGLSTTSVTPPLTSSSTITCAHAVDGFTPVLLRGGWWVGVLDDL
jgi:hypothetical protein